MPRSSVGRLASPLGLILIQLTRPSRARLAPIVSDATRDELLRATSVHQRLAKVGFWSHDVPVLLYSTLAAVSIAERAGEWKELQQAYAILGFVACLTGLPRVYAHYRWLAETLGQRINHPDTSAFGELLRAVYHNFTGRFDEVHAAATSAATLYAQLGDRFRLRESIILRGYACLHRGDFAGARGFFEECYRDAASDGAPQGMAWSVGGMLAVELATGQPIQEGRVAMLDELIDRGIDHSDRIMAQRLLARLRFDRGERGEPPD